jgi:hypothetical protein
MLEKPLPLDQILLDTLSPRDKAFAFVAATWMSGVDEDVDDKEKALLDRLAGELGLSADRRAELERIARDLESKGGSRNWGDELVGLLKAIPPRLENEQGEVEVAFE